MDRSKSWIIREALGERRAEEERRHELAKEALRGVDEGHVLSHEEVLARAALKAQARAKDSMVLRARLGGAPAGSRL